MMKNGVNLLAHTEARPALPLILMILCLYSIFVPKLCLCVWPMIVASSLLMFTSYFSFSSVIICHHTHHFLSCGPACVKYEMASLSSTLYITVI